MDLSIEIKRKLFHYLSLVYLLIYAVCPREWTIGLLWAALVLLSATEFLRLRRPELNAWFLKKFGGLHRPAEIMAPSGIFWTLMGCCLLMALLMDKNIVMAALGMLAFGDTAAAMWGRRRGKRAWVFKPISEDSSPLAWAKFWRIPANHSKTLEGSGAFAVMSFLWISLFLRPHVALLGALAGAWVESRQTEWDDNFWIPVGGGLLLAVISLLLAGGAGQTLHLWQKIGIAVYLAGALSGLWWLSRSTDEGTV
ncbi:MAG: hypothetical protein WC859_07230 [Elusimicrobiota bacterium]